METTYDIARKELDQLIQTGDLSSYELIIKINAVLEERRMADAYTRIATALEQIALNTQK